MPDGTYSPLDDVRPWDSLSDEEKALFARMAEVFAGFSEYTDDADRAASSTTSSRPASSRTRSICLLRRQRRVAARAAPTARSTRTSSSTAGPTRSTENLAAPRRPRQPEHLQPLPDRLGDGVLARRSRCSSATPTTAGSAIRSSSPGRRAIEARGRGTPPVPPRHRHRARRSSTAAGSSSRGRSTGVEQVRFRASPCATPSTPPTPPTARERQYYAMLGTRGHLAAGLEGRHRARRPPRGSGSFDDDKWQLCTTPT